MSCWVDRGGKTFMFLFAIVLFCTPLGASVNDAQISAHREHFTQRLQRYLIFQANGDQDLAARRLGKVMELITIIQE